MSEVRQPDPRTLEDIIYYYSEKKRLKNKGYKFISSEKVDYHIREAAILCEELEMTPAQYIQLIYDNLGPKQVEHFNLQHLHGTAAEHFFRDRNKNDSYVVELTKENLPYEDVWGHMLELCRRQMKQGRAMEEVLLDSSLKLYGWFRILASPDPIPSVIENYKHIARLEMNNRLMDFIKESGLDVDRVLN